ncbi:MAG: SDR family NAD(P)-dependent oxidoreductase, partial [Actinomycetota bacterium]
VDVASEAEVTEMIRATSADFGLDILVNNAGVSVSGPADAVPIEDWRWVVDVNLWAHVYAIRAALPIFRERGSGHLVHVSSAGGILGTPGLAAYCMTKFAVYGLAESVAVALHGTGVGVSVVCPLWVDTDITNRGRLTPDPQMGVDEATLKLLGREMLRTQGLPPEKVAESIVSGVEEDRFLILPHPEVQAFATAKWEDPERYIHRAAEVLDARRRLFGDSS